MPEVELSEVYNVDGLYDVLVSGVHKGGVVLVEAGGERYWEATLPGPFYRTVAGTFDDVKAQIESFYQGRPR